MHCNNCGTEMCDLVIADNWYVECRITVNGEPYAPLYYLYICPKCGNVQASRVEKEEA